MSLIENFHSIELMKFLSTFNQTGSMNGMIKVKTMWMITDLFTWDQREHGMHTNDALVIVLPFMIRLTVMNDDE